MAEQTPTIEQGHHGTRPETSAWLLLIGFFLLFCTLVAAIGWVSWRSYTGAMQPVDGSLVRVHARAGVTYQAKGSARQDTPVSPCNDNTESVVDICQKLAVGDRVRARPEAGYGPVASITLPDQTRLADLYAYPSGTDVTLTKYEVSRWSKQRQDVELRQNAGYVRYDVPSRASQQYDQVSYSVTISNGVRIALDLGGSYSINVPPIEPGQPPLLAGSGQPLLAEIAVRAGSAEVRTSAGVVSVGENQKVQIDTNKVVSQPLDATWQLVHDSSFMQYETGEPVDSVHSWYVYNQPFDPTVTEQERNGGFDVYFGCGPVTPSSFCAAKQSTYIGQFHREGGQTKSFMVGVTQTLDLDISEYRSLEFSMWARVVQQSVPQAGIANIECPITIQFSYKQESLSSSDENRYICVYKSDSNQPIANAGKLGEWSYQGVLQNQWYHLSFNLRDAPLLPGARYLKEVRIYANGHDYISEITDVSLIATQQP